MEQMKNILLLLLIIFPKPFLGQVVNDTVYYYIGNRIKHISQFENEDRLYGTKITYRRNGDTLRFRTYQSGVLDGFAFESINRGKVNIYFNLRDGKVEGVVEAVSKDRSFIIKEYFRNGKLSDTMLFIDGEGEVLSRFFPDSTGSYYDFVSLRGLWDMPTLSTSFLYNKNIIPPSAFSFEVYPNTRKRWFSDRFKEH